MLYYLKLGLDYFTCFVVRETGYFYRTPKIQMQVVVGMSIRLTRKPGQKGTRQLQLVYGDKLVCVRYRYDEAKRKRSKTVELVVEEHEWMPDDTLVRVRVAWGEKDLGVKVKQAGGRWLSDVKLWELPYGKAVALGLAERVVRDWV
jgi:hypothetical protein